MRLILLFALLLSSGCINPAADEATRQKHIVLESTQDFAAEVGYSEAVQVGQTLWVSGQVGFDVEGVTAQSRNAFENLERVLTEAGSSLADIVELTTYHVSEDQFEAFMAVKNEFIQPPYPAWTAIEVKGLLDPSLLVEVKAVAVIGSGTTQ